MPIKFEKEISTQLFRYIRNIDFHMNPFDARTRSARELLRQVQAKRYVQANPKLAIKIDMHDRPDPPKATFSFVDGTEQAFQTSSNTAHEILFQIHLKAMQLDAEFEMAGKSVDDI